MKKLFLVGAVALFGALNAQETSEGFVKGNTFITGAVGVTSTKTGDFKESGTMVKTIIVKYVKK